MARTWTWISIPRILEQSGEYKPQSCFLFLLMQLRPQKAAVFRISSIRTTGSRGPYLGRAETFTRVWNVERTSYGASTRQTNTLPYIYYRFHAQYLDGVALACNRSRVPNADVARFSNCVQIRIFHICSKIRAYSAFFKLVRTSLWCLSFDTIKFFC